MNEAHTISIAHVRIVNAHDTFNLFSFLHGDCSEQFTTAPPEVGSEAQGNGNVSDRNTGNNDASSNCCICYDTDSNCKLPCQHLFHNRCIMYWFQSGRFNCPSCLNRYGAVHVIPIVTN